MKSFTKIVLLLQLMLFFSNVHAQVITGCVVDKDRKPLEFATVAVMALKDSSYIQGDVSGNDGRFSIAVNKSDKVLLQVSMVGYRRYVAAVPVGDVGTIVMEEDTNMIKDVLVTAARPAYSMKGSSIVTHVQGSVLAKAGTAVDVIAHLPGIRQEDDKFSVIGKGEPIIYVNNRRLQNLTELSTISSAEIASVEVNMNPGNKYGATVKSVIIIRTIKKVGDGIGGKAYSNVRQAHSFSWAQGFDLSWRKGNVDVFGGFSYERNKYYQSQRNNYLTTTPSALWLLASGIKILPKSTLYTTNVGFNWQISENHSVGVRYDLTATPRGRSLWSTKQNVYQADVLQEEISYETQWKRREGPIHTVNAYYAGKMGAFTIKWDNDLYHSSSDALQNIQQNSSANGASAFSSDNKVKNKLFASKLEISVPVGKGEIEGGAEYNYTSRGDVYVPSHSNFVATNDQIRQNLWAGFLSYDLTLGKVDLSAGLRHEHISVNYYEKGTLVEEQSRTYNNVYPDLSLSFPVGGSNWSLSYTAKTKRPGYSQLSSNLQYDDKFTYEKGNPLLKEETIHDVTLSWFYKWAYLSASYQRVHNAIVSEILPYENNSPINVMTNKNLDNLTKYSFVVSLRPTIGIWSPNLILNAMGQDFSMMHNGEKKSLNTPLVFANLYNGIRLPKDYQFNVDLSYHNNGDIDVMELKKSWQLNLGLSKSLGNWFFLLQGNDIFKTARNSMITYGAQMKLDKWNYSDSQNIKFTVRYQFNVAQSKYKGKSAGDDERNRF